MIIFDMIKRQKKAAFLAVIFCMDCLKDEFERDALDPNRAAPGGALKWCSGMYVATAKAKQQRHPSGATARESTLECREKHPQRHVRRSLQRAPCLGSRHATYA